MAHEIGVGHLLIQGFVLLLLSFALLEHLGGVGLLDHPVEDEVVLVSHAVEEVLEELAEVADVGLLLELEAPAVVHVDRELFGVALGQGFDRGRELLVADLFVFLLLCLRGETLPGETAAAEVHQHKAQRLEVVSSRLL